MKIQSWNSNTDYGKDFERYVLSGAHHGHTNPIIYLIQTARRGHSTYSTDPLQTSCDVSQFSISQLEKCIVTSCYVSKRSCQNKEGPLVAVLFDMQFFLPARQDGAIILLANKHKNHHLPAGISYQLADLYQLAGFKPPTFFNIWAIWLKCCRDV